MRERGSPGHRRLRGLLLASACLLALTAPAMGGTLVETVRTAIANNPDVALVRANRRAVDQELRQARARLFPQLDVELRYGPEWSHNDATRSAVDGDDSRLLARREATLTLRQLLFDGFETPAEIARQRARVDSAARRVRQNSEFVALDAIQAHLEVLRRQGIVDLAERNVRRHEEIVAKVRRLEREGRVSIADLRQAEARLAQAREDLARARGDLADARAAYLRVVGAAPENLVLDPAPEDALPAGREDAAARASVANPAVLVALADVDAAEAELRKVRAGFYPDLDLQLEANYGEGVAGTTRPAGRAAALLVLRYNLYRGGADVAAEREAHHRVNEARARLVKARRAAEEDARTSWNAWETARARVEALRTKAEAQRRTRDAYAQQFELGQRSLLDLLDAENELFLARVSLRTAEFTERFAVYRLLAATGELLATLDVAAPREHVNVRRTPGQEATPERVEEKSRYLDDPRMERRALRGEESGEPPREDYDVTPHTGRPPAEPVTETPPPAAAPAAAPEAGGPAASERPYLLRYLFGGRAAAEPPTAPASAEPAKTVAADGTPAAGDAAPTPAPAAVATAATGSAAAGVSPAAGPAAPEPPATLATMLSRWFGRGGD